MGFLGKLVGRPRSSDTIFGNVVSFESLIQLNPLKKYNVLIYNTYISQTRLKVSGLYRRMYCQNIGHNFWGEILGWLGRICVIYRGR